MFFLLSIVLLLITFLMMGLIVRDVLPYLEPREQEYFRAWFHNWGT